MATIQSIMDLIEQAVEKALAMWTEGYSLSDIRNWMKQQYQISDEMAIYVADELGISLDEFYGETGRSFDLTRKERPINTAWIIAGLVGSMLATANDGLRNGTAPVPGYVDAADESLTPITVKKSPLWKYLKQGMFKKALKFAKYKVNSYVRTEYSHAKATIERESKPKQGYKWVYIPFTEKGYRDECREIEGKWYEVGKDQLPMIPVHVNCRHRYEWHKERP